MAEEDAIFCRDLPILSISIHPFSKTHHLLHSTQQENKKKDTRALNISLYFQIMNFWISSSKN
jgi:hypothetical protein